MRILEGGYANYFNARHRRSGHLFQNRFKNTLVGEDPYFLELLRYIHLNPLRAGMVADLAALERYPWTGHAAMVGQNSVSWHDTIFGLLHFGQTWAAAQTAYRVFVADGLGQPEPNLDGGGLRRSLGLWQRLNPLRRGRENWSFDERIYGSSDFVDAVLADLHDADHPWQTGAVDIGRFVDHVVRPLAGRSGVGDSLLRSNSKRPDVVNVRRALCYLATCEAGLPASQLAQHLGIDASTVRRNAAPGQQALAELCCLPHDLLPVIAAQG